MSQQNINLELLPYAPPDPVTTPASVQQCYLVVRIDREPPDDDDDVSDGYYEYNLSMVTATSKEAAISAPINRLLAKGYREMDAVERRDDEVREWTDEWFDVTFEVFAPIEPGFWDYASWEDAQKALVKWTAKNGALACQILASSRAGDSDGHTAIANDAAFVSAVDKWNIAMTVPAGKLKKTAGKARRL